MADINIFNAVLGLFVGVPLLYLVGLSIMLAVGGVIGCARCLFGRFAQSEVTATVPSVSTARH